MSGKNDKPGIRVGSGWVEQILIDHYLWCSFVEVKAYRHKRGESESGSETLLYSADSWHCICGIACMNRRTITLQNNSSDPNTCKILQGTDINIGV